MTRRDLLRHFAALLGAAPLAACGRKAPLTPPDQIDPSDDNDYELWPEDDDSGDELWPEDADPNPGEGDEDGPWIMDIDPSIDPESEP
jgi:predicted small lipoprotein YifL